MARRCESTGKGVQCGYRVSHAHNKTKRRFLPNLLRVSVRSDILGQSFRLRIAASTLRSIEHRGGFDAFLLKIPSTAVISPRVRDLKRKVEARKRLIEAGAAGTTVEQDKPTEQIPSPEYEDEGSNLPA